MADTDTGGGASVGGKAQAGGDLSGRDSTSVGRDYIDMGGRNASKTDRDLLEEVVRALSGNPFNSNEPGLVSLVAGMLKTLDGVVKFQDDATTERRVLTERIDATDGEVLHIREAFMWIALSMGVFFLGLTIVYLIVFGVIPIS